MTGPLEGIEVSKVKSSYYTRDGLHVFPTARFHCNGHILGVWGITYFESISNDFFYNRTLVMNLQVWRQNQSHYAPTGINSSVTFSPESIATGSASDTAPFYFSDSQNYTFNLSLDAPIDVVAGDILGIYLPPSTRYATRSTLINSIHIDLADDFQNPVFDSLPRACWSPTLGTTLCNLVSSAMTPLLSVNFASTSLPTGELAFSCLPHICLCSNRLYTVHAIAALLLLCTCAGCRFHTSLYQL